MKVITEGHLYGLENFDKSKPGGENSKVLPDGSILSFQELQFIHKGPTVPGGTFLETITNGTTNEEVLRVLIDRVKFLNTKFPCRENAIALTHIETALMWLEKRTADRKERGVEGKAEN
jgi:hypothetical protein